MKYKNIAALLAAAMMALTLLAGCAKGGRAETRRQRNCGVGGGL